MYKLITFDGPSASGKFTQSCRLCKHLQIEQLNDSLFSVMRHMTDLGIYSDSLLRPIIWLSIVRLSYAFDWKKREIFTLGGFWQYIIDFFAWGDISNNNRNVLMDAFDTIIQTNAEDIYPTCSFYLDVSTYETKTRFIKREARLAKTQGLEDIRIDGLSESPKNREQDRVLREAAYWLSGRYPFFHVIDAARSEDEVFNEIVRLTEAAL